MSDTDDLHELNLRTETAVAPDAWMLSFADLLSLILTFFVLLYSMSVMEEKRWSDIREALTKQLNPSKDPNYVTYSSDLTVSRVKENPALDLDYLSSILSEKIESTATKDVVITRYPDRIVISLPSSTLFEPGSATLRQNAYDITNIIADSLNTIGNRININGHSDPDAIETDIYPSNWELSLARALAITKELYKAGYPYQIRTFGLADSRFLKDTTSLDEEEKKKLYQHARRVDIVIRSMKADRLVH